MGQHPTTLIKKVVQNPKTIMQSYMGPNSTTIISEKWFQILRVKYKQKWVNILRLKYKKVGQNPKKIMQSYMGANHLTIISEKWVQILRQ